MKRTLRSLIIMLLVCFSGVAFAQGTSGIAGTFKDEKGEPVVNGNVIVTQGGINRGIAVTDYDGNYVVKPLTAGRYDVKFTYQGKDETVTGVIVSTDALTTLNERLKTSNTLGGVVVHSTRIFQRALIDPRAPGGHNTHDAESIEKAATHNIGDIATLSTQSYQSRNGAGVGLGGGRVGTGTLYVIDGQQLSTGNAQFTNQPQGSVEQVTTYVSGIPAKYGDASGGVITITTKGVTDRPRGSLLLEHSVDGYNHNQASFNLSGPFFSRRDSLGHKKPVIGYNINGEGIYDADNNPTYDKNYVLKSDVQSRLEQHPLALVPNTTGSPTLGYAAEYVNKGDFELQKQRPNATYERGSVGGKLIYSLNDNVNIAMGGSFFALDQPSYDRNYMLFSNDNFSRQRAYTGRGYIRFTQKFGHPAVTAEKEKNNTITNAFYTVQADYEKDYVTLQDKNHKHNTFDYGYVGKFDEQYSPIYIPGSDTVTGIFANRLVGYAPSGVIFTRSEINPGLANYTSDYYALSGNSTLNQNQISNGRGLRNGDGPNQVYALWNNIGASQRGWSQSNNDQVAVTVDASFDIKHNRTTHSIEFGLYYQQRNQRYFSVNGAYLWTLMRNISNRVVTGSQVDYSDPDIIVGGKHYTAQDYKNGLVNPSPNDTIMYHRLFNANNQGKFDKTLRAKLNLGQYDYINTDALDPSTFSLDMFSADELLNSGTSPVSYYGYDYTGKPVNGTVNFNDFWTKKDADGNYTRPIGAYRPNYIAGYISDYIQYKDFQITLGMRVERFDANTKVLKDPYSLYATQKATADNGAQNLINGSHPANIGSDYTVYVADNASKKPEIVGYRNGDTWYDPYGREIQDPNSLTLYTNGKTPQPYLQTNADGSPAPKIRDTNFHPENSFTDYKPQVNVMPRVNFSFPIGDNALFYAHYDVLVQRPVSTSAGAPTSYATPVDYFYLDQSAQGIVGNPDLKPERTIDYEVGLQQKLSSLSALTISGFYKERKDQIQVRPYLNAYPNTYFTYGNRDFSTTKGFSLTYDLRRIGNISMVINYTLSFSEGTGSTATSANGGSGTSVSQNGLLQNFISAGLPNLRNPFALDYDSRHNLNAQIDYRFTDNQGPTISGHHFLQNAGANLIFRAHSGEPYTRFAQAQSLLQGTLNSGLIDGTVNGSRIPFHYMLDLNIDKDFGINFHGKKHSMVDKRRNGGLALNAYVLIQNLLNTKDITQVYGYSGRADDDGYLTSPEGATTIPNQVNQQSFTDLYSIRSQDYNFINNPRRIVLGIKVIF